MDTFLFWYAILISALFILSAFGKVGLKLAGKYDVTPRSVQIEELVSVPFILVSVIALYGYINEIAIFSALFWQVYFVLTILQIIVAFWLPKQKWLKSELPLNKFVVVNVIGTGIGIPLYYMLYEYAFALLPQL